MKFSEINDKMKKHVNTCLSHYPNNTIHFPIVSYDSSDNDSLEHAYGHINHFINLFDTDTWSLLLLEDGGSYSFSAKDAETFLKEIYHNYKKENWTIFYNVRLHCFDIAMNRINFVVRPVDVENS